MPDAPCRAAQMIVELSQPAQEILRGATQRDGEPLHHHGVDPQRPFTGHSGKLMNLAWSHRAATLVAMTQAPRRPQVELLTRDGCTICARVHARLAELAAELGFELSMTDVDAVAAAGNPGLRAEYGDRLPVILLDGREHSYWELDEARLRRDLATS